METWLCRSVERTVAGACDLVVVTSVEPPEGAVAELVQRLLDATAPNTVNPAAPLQGSSPSCTVSEQATLSNASLTPVGSQQYVTVLQISPHEEAVRAKELLCALIRHHRKSFPTVLSASWIDRSVVEAHGEAAAAHLHSIRGSTASFLPPAQRLQTQLESLLCATAHRRKPRQSAAVNKIVAPESDVDSCLVLYVDAPVPAPPTMDSTGVPSLNESQASQATVSEVLEWLESVIQRRSLPLLEHIRDVDKGRLFLRLSSPDDASKTRQLLITLARDTSPQLRDKINTATLKPCSMSDFERVRRKVHS